MVNAFTLFAGLLILFSVGTFSIFQQSILFFLLLTYGFFLSISILNFFNRIKFFLLAITLIFSLSVPGEIILFYYFLSITKEGVELAVFNVLRLSNIFLVVFILLKTLPRSFIISTVIKVCLFTTIFGVEKDRLITRVYLTFEYLELYRSAKFRFNTLSKDIAKQIDSDYSKKVNPKIKQINIVTKDIFWILSFIFIFTLLHFGLL